MGIAQALIHDPKLIILDEPTSGLDPNQLMKIRDLLLQLSSNKCILFSSHILNEVESLCDRVIIINSGKIIMDKYKSELTSSIEETFKKLINT